jgi:hypothetical protein
MGYRGQKLIAEADRYARKRESYWDYIIELHYPIRVLLEGLEKRGFRINKGYKDCGILLAVWQKAGGYYIGKCVLYTLTAGVYMWSI